MNQPQLSLGAKQLLSRYAQANPLDEQQLDALGRLQGEVGAEQIRKILGEVPDQVDALCRDPVKSTRWLGGSEVAKLDEQVQPLPQPVIPRGRAPRAYDPIRGTLQIHKKDKVVIIANQSKWEASPAEGVEPRPQLLQIVARTAGNSRRPTEPDWKRLQRRLETARLPELVHHAGEEGERLLQQISDLESLKQLDIKWISDRDAVVKIEDRHEDEFRAGDAMNAIALGADGIERSRDLVINPDNTIRRITWWSTSPWDRTTPDKSRAPVSDVTEPLADTAAPNAYHDRIDLRLRGKRSAPRGIWLDDAGSAQHFDMVLRVGKGWLREAASTGSVSLLNRKLDVSVADDDAYGVGNLPKVGSVRADEQMTIRQLMREKIALEWQRTETDRATLDISVQDAFARTAGLDGVQMGGRTLKPLGRPTAYRESIAGLIANKTEDCNGRQTFSVRLTDQFLTAGDPAQLAGWTIDVGRRIAQADGSTSWVPASRNGTDSVLKLDGKDWPSRSAKFSFELADFEKEIGKQNAPPVEVLIYDRNGIPVESIRIPLEKFDWA